jgi:C4-dicarboxylate transporter DctQ subunit
MLDERSASDLQFPMWLYYLCLPVGSGLMLIRYVIRLVRYLFYFDPATMAPGHLPATDELGDVPPPSLR